MITLCICHCHHSYFQNGQARGKTARSNSAVEAIIRHICGSTGIPRWDRAHGGRCVNDLQTALFTSLGLQPKRAKWACTNEHIRIKIRQSHPRNSIIAQHCSVDKVGRVIKCFLGIPYTIAQSKNSCLTDRPYLKPLISHIPCSITHIQTSLLYAYQYLKQLPSTVSVSKYNAHASYKEAVKSLRDSVSVKQC